MCAANGINKQKPRVCQTNAAVFIFFFTVLCAQGWGRRTKDGEPRSSLLPLVNRISNLISNRICDKRTVACIHTDEFYCQLKNRP